MHNAQEREKRVDLSRQLRRELLHLRDLARLVELNHGPRQHARRFSRNAVPLAFAMIKPRR